MAQESKRANSLWPHLKDGVATLKFIAASGGADEDKASSIIDDYIIARARSVSNDPLAVMMRSLRDLAKAQKDTRRSAVIAAGRMDQLPEHPEMLVTHARQLIMHDGQVTEAEAAALRAVVNRAVAARQQEQ